MNDVKLKAAIFRLLSDIIKLDNIISPKEIELMDKTIEKYEITSHDIKIASYMTISEAIDLIANAKEKLKNDVYDILYNSIRSDDYCSREEATLLHAIKECLFCDNHDDYKVLSVDAYGVAIQTDKIVYVSAEDRVNHPVLSDKDEFEELNNLTRLSGFQLVYVPAESARYTSKNNRKALEKVMRLIAPALDDEKIQSGITSLAAMTPRWFMLHVLCEKIGLPSSQIPTPSWMIRLPDNTVERKPMANFLFVKVDQDDIRGQLKKMTSSISLFQNRFSVNINFTSREEGVFEYSGFMRSVMEIIATSSDIRWEIIIRCLGCKEFIDENGQQQRTSITIRKGDKEYPLIQGDRDAAFYALILMGTALDGGVHFLRGDLKVDDIIQKRYEMIYNSLRTGMDSPIISFYKTRNPIKSRLIKAIREDKHLLDENDLYQIIESGNTLSIPLGISHIKVVYRDGVRQRETPLSESPLFEKFKSISSL